MQSLFENLFSGLLGLVHLVEQLVFVRSLELILFVIVVVGAMLAVRILLDLTSAKHRRKYTRVTKYCLLFGLGLGLVLPWFERLGLALAAALSIVFLSLSIYYYLLRGRAGTFSLLHRVWVPRERIRDWFLYFSVLTGVIGIVSTLLSVLISPFMSLTFGSVVPLAFDTLSVLSALMEFTITIPFYTTLYALLGRYLSTKQASNPAFVEDLDFSSVLVNTSHSYSDLLDALESLARDGMATRSSSNPLAKVRFTLNEAGGKLVESCEKESNVRLQHEREFVESSLDYLAKRMSDTGRFKRVVRRRALNELEKLRRRVAGLIEAYGMLVDSNWLRATTQRIESLNLQLVSDI